MLSEVADWPLPPYDGALASRERQRPGSDRLPSQSMGTSTVQWRTLGGTRRG